jgi:hypothetical protein
MSFIIGLITGIAGWEILTTFLTGYRTKRLAEAIKYNGTFLSEADLTKSKYYDYISDDVKKKTKSKAKAKIKEAK